jgi:hypothetical protein
MDTPDTPMISDLAQLLFVTVAFAAGLIAAAVHRRKQRVAAAAVAGGASEIIYRETPTVRVVESQRVDRVRKIARLMPGAHVDVLEVPAGFPPRFRVTLKELTRIDDTDAARLVVDFNGTQASCGPLVSEVRTNEFIVPRATRDETRSSVFHFYDRGHGLDFMRIKVRAIDVQAGSAEIDVLQVAAAWPAGSES